MAALGLAAAFLLLTHFGLSSTPLRGALVARLGPRAYLGLYSLIAVAALVWLVAAYAGAPHVPLWDVAPWQRWVPILVMPFALLLLVGGYTQPNPTAVGQEARIEASEPPVCGVLRITRNPIMWGVGLWALAHLVPNGDLASVLLFGSLAALALGGTLLIDRKKARRHGPAWHRFAAETSNLPFAAILAGRQRLGWREIGWVRGSAAVALYVVLWELHPWLFGAAPMVP